MIAGGIYRIACAVNGRVYVGSAVNLDRRIKHHRYTLRKGTHHSRQLQRAWDKYGSGAFCFEVLEVVDDANDVLIAREQFWIDRLSAYGKGYNGKALAGNSIGWVHTPEARAKMSEARKGKPSPKRGVPISSAQREILRAARLGSHPSPETIAKRLASRAGYRHSDETKQKMSESAKRRCAR